MRLGYSKHSQSGGKSIELFRVKAQHTAPSPQICLAGTSMKTGSAKATLKERI